MKPADRRGRKTCCGCRSRYRRPAGPARRCPGRRPPDRRRERRGQRADGREYHTGTTLGGPRDMPLYMDVHHKLDGATAELVEQAHLADIEAQAQYQVEYLKYWFNEQVRKVFCLVRAPSADAAVAVHKVAHGLVPEDIIEVNDGMVDAFLGGMP